MARYSSARGLTKEGQDFVRDKLSKKGWTQELWASFSNVSLSTVKRLFQGKRITPYILQILLEVLGLELDETYFTAGAMITTVQAFEEVSSSHPASATQLYGVVMTGNYN